MLQSKPRGKREITLENHVQRPYSPTGDHMNQGSRGKPECRAKFITGSVAALQQKPEGGDKWLLSLRAVPYQEAVSELITLPGIGPKVNLPPLLV